MLLYVFVWLSSTDPDEPSDGEEDEEHTGHWNAYVVLTHSDTNTYMYG